MKLKSDETDLERLRRQAETALRRADSRREAEPLLERIASLAPEESEHSAFAHRNLAELRLEETPWVAALHLRRIVQAGHDDDITHALLGLCHALLGNFRSAVSAYRQALTLSPSNPWYHHNLGHLLDVALGNPSAAVTHLRLAHRTEPLEDEITASLAHCLAMTGELAEAAALAKEAANTAPKNRDHKALLDWIGLGAPKEDDPNSAARASLRTGTEPPKKPVNGRSRRGGDRRSNAVLQVLEQHMGAAGFSAEQLEQARALWADFREGRTLRVAKPEVYAAALEYAVALVQGRDGVTQSSIARRYGVAAASLSSRFGQIRDALSLQPFDPRYAAL